MKIALIGYGKMGTAIEDVAAKLGHKIISRINKSNLDNFTLTHISKADVAIEFTSPESAYENVTRCLNWGLPVVCGTTGWIDNLDKIKNYCKEVNGSFIYASNFSIGVNIFFEMNKRLAKIMQQYKEYNVKIEETHHTQKKDSPSGTAITLANDIIKQNSNKKVWKINQQNNEDELKIESKRINTITGTHKVIYSSLVDDIEIIHEAHNRIGFAKGAILAAEYLIKNKGVYTMNDVLGI